MGFDSLPQAHVTTKPAGYTKKVFALFSRSSYQEIESCVEERRTQGDKHRVPRENAPLAAFKSDIAVLRPRPQNDNRWKELVFPTWETNSMSRPSPIFRPRFSPATCSTLRKPLRLTAEST